MKRIADNARRSTAEANKLPFSQRVIYESPVKAQLDIPLGPKTPWEVTGSAMFLSLCKGAMMASRFDRITEVVSSSDELS